VCVTQNRADKVPHQNEIISAILQAEPGVQKVVLFGSRARRSHRRQSDIDIGVYAEKKLSVMQLARIDEALNAIEMLHTVDVVDFTGRADRFTTEALSDTQILYEKRHPA